MYVRESMSKELISILHTASVADAEGLMRSHQIRHLPVRNESGTVVGIVSDRDLRKAEGGDVGSVMNWPVITAHRDLPLREAALGMLSEKISALLVTDDNKEIIGILTTDDLLRKLIDVLPPATAVDKVAFSPVVDEFIREAQASGL